MHWIFGYGSVIWNPGFNYLEKRKAAACGWTRRFWQGSTDHRGVPGRPGRVVTLVPAENELCWGMAYRLSLQEWEKSVAYMDVREQGGYRQEWISLTDGERSWKSLAYLAEPGNPDYLGPAPLDHLVRQIATASGPSGHNRDYLLDLALALRGLGVRDPHVEELEAALKVWEENLKHAQSA